VSWNGNTPRAQLLLDALRPRLERALAQREPLPDGLWRELLAYGQAMDAVDNLRNQRLLLEDIRARWGDNPSATPAIRDGYVNAGGGWRLDLPLWLEEIERQLSALRQAGPAHETAAARIALLRPALERAQRERGLAPEIVAQLTAELWNALNDSLVTTPDPAAAQDVAISLLEAALTVYTPERFPQGYAMTQNNLGNAYAERLGGEKRANRSAPSPAMRRRSPFARLSASPSSIA
jgi:hypothetical protein